MEFEGDDGTTHQQPYQRKITQIPSTSTLTLPSELITEILLRLPVKSLLKFRSVSKLWLSLISTSEFIKTHLTISANNKEHTHHKLMMKFSRPDYNLQYACITSLLHDSVTEVFDLEYPMKYPHKSVSVVGSVNGLICLVVGKEKLFIWNPSIRKFKKLPDSTALQIPHAFMYGHCFKFGFGYDRLHDDYKVVVGYRNSFYGSSSPRTKLKIYSLNSDSWRIMDDFQGEVRSTKSGVFVNGKLHWASTTQSWDVICFDLADGKWEKVEQPCYGEGHFNPALGVLGGDLSVYCDYRSHADAWIMKEYGVKESWIKIFTINLRDDSFRYLFTPPFCISNRGEIIYVFDSGFLIYNPKDASSRCSKVADSVVFFKANIYIESLVWPF